VGYLENATGPVSLVLDLRITHERFGSSSDPSICINGHLDSFMRLLFLQTHRETDRFFADSGVQFVYSNSGLFHYYRPVFSSHLKSKIGNILPKTVTLRIILNIDGVPVTSRSHTHPSHSQISRLLTSSLSLGVPVPLVIQCM
jgi:hypothetical protein